MFIFKLSSNVLLKSKPVSEANLVTKLGSCRASDFIASESQDQKIGRYIMKIKNRILILIFEG